MEGVVNGVFYCQQERTQELSDRIYDRNTTSAPIKMSYSIRPAQTRRVHMPILDTRKEATVPCQQKPTYNTDTMFPPATSLPFNGYQANIDVETRLRDTIFPLQACPQADFIPGSHSDMYNSSYLVAESRPVHMTNQLLFTQERFAPFNPNTCNTGFKLFNNHTRVQIRNLD